MKIRLNLRKENNEDFRLRSFDVFDSRGSCVRGEHKHSEGCCKRLAICPSQATGCGAMTQRHRGSAVASSHYPISSPSLDGHAREFSMSYSNKGGERFSLTFGHNSEVTHFVYDTYVYVNERVPAGEPGNGYEPGGLERQDGDLRLPMLRQFGTLGVLDDRAQCSSLAYHRPCL
jgi:hypothetical protein